jgi:hypothetical protein
MQQFKFRQSAFHQARAGLYNALSLSVLPHPATKNITVFNTTRGWPARVGKKEMDERCPTFSHTCPSGGRLSRSEISSSGEVLGFGISTRLLIVGIAAKDLELAGTFSLGLMVADLDAAAIKHRLLRLGHLPGGGNFWFCGCLRDRREVERKLGKE